MVNGVDNSVVNSYSAIYRPNLMTSLLTSSLSKCDEYAKVILYLKSQCDTTSDAAVGAKRQGMV